jgi:histidine decarboxylase
MASKLNKHYKYLEKSLEEVSGHAFNPLFDYSHLYKFLAFPINNCGDPFQQTSIYRINTFPFEKEVLEEFARLYRAGKEYWGYVTNGSTEGNLFGLYLAREKYSKSKVFLSEETHYSVYKNLKILGMEWINIKAQENGEIDYNDLRKKLLENGKTPPIILATIGTAIKGATDSVPKIKSLLKDLKLKKHYIHCDAALFGMTLPYLPLIKEQEFDFKAGSDSIAVSGHKITGMGIPCGIVLARKEDAKKIASDVEYTRTTDSTISGSRNGITPLFLWHVMIDQKREKLLKKSALLSIKKADYLIKKLSKQNISAWRNPSSHVVVFPRPSEKIRNHWQLAVSGKIARFITTPNISYKALDLLAKDLANSQASDI